MTEFQFRLLAEEPYHEVVRQLELVAAGDAGVLADLVGRVRVALAKPAIVESNARSAQLRLWQDWLDSSPPPSPATALRLGEAAVAALCMPGFQVHPLAGDDASPTLVVLGDMDGGLFGLLTAELDGFHPWLVRGLAERAERFGYGTNMFRMDRDDVLRFTAALRIDSKCAGAPQPEHCKNALLALRRLLERASTGEVGVAVAESG